MAHQQPTHAQLGATLRQYICRTFRDSLKGDTIYINNRHVRIGMKNVFDMYTQHCWYLLQRHNALLGSAPNKSNYVNQGLNAAHSYAFAHGVPPQPLIAIDPAINMINPPQRNNMAVIDDVLLTCHGAQGQVNVGGPAAGLIVPAVNVVGQVAGPIIAGPAAQQPQAMAPASIVPGSAAVVANQAPILAAAPASSLSAHFQPVSIVAVPSTPAVQSSASVIPDPLSASASASHSALIPAPRRASTPWNYGNDNSSAMRATGATAPSTLVNCPSAAVTFSQGPVPVIGNFGNPNIPLENQRDFEYAYRAAAQDPISRIRTVLGHRVNITVTFATARHSPLPTYRHQTAFELAYAMAAGERTGPPATVARGPYTVVVSFV